jgi:sigma-B regulation protein RsbU (phosphoserine phosphatase)
MCVAIPEDGAANYLLYALSATQRPRSEVEPAMLADVVAGACRVGIQSFQQRERERVHREIERELQSARVVQEQLLPASHGRVGTLDYAYVNLPGRFVSGDFVDVIAIDEHRTAVIVGDVMGEGPPAAVLMSSVVSQLRTALSLGCPVTKAVHALNQRLLAKPAAGRFVTLWVGLLDDRRRELRVIDAGHGLWFLAGQSLGEINPVDLATCPIGVVDHGEPEELVISLEPGASVVVVTDGITECRDPGSGALMGLAPLRSLALDAPVATCADDVMACAKRHAAGAGFRDDATVIVLRLTH